jgi:hypothetical protein
MKYIKHSDLQKLPAELTDTEIRIVLGLTNVNDELGSLGNPEGRLKAWPRTYEGGIRANYKNYSFDSPENLFYSVDRDPRKNFFRSDNQERVLNNSGTKFSASYNIKSVDSHSYTNRSIDDITDKVILINVTGEYKEFNSDKQVEETKKLH